MRARESEQRASLPAAIGNDTFPSIRSFLPSHTVSAICWIHAMRNGSKAIYILRLLLHENGICNERTRGAEKYPTVQKNMRRGIYLSAHLFWTAGRTHPHHTVVPRSVSIESTLQSPPIPPSIGNLGVDAVSPKLHRPPRITIAVEIGARRLGRNRPSLPLPAADYRAEEGKGAGTIEQNSLFPRVASSQTRKKSTYVSIRWNAFPQIIF